MRVTIGRPVGGPVFEPDPDLVTTHRVDPAPGVSVVFDQTLWGKVIAVREIHVEGGRWELEDYLGTARLRQLLEATTLEGAWAYGPEHTLRQQLMLELMSLVMRWGGGYSEAESSGG